MFCSVLILIWIYLVFSELTAFVLALALALALRIRALVTSLRSDEEKYLLIETPANVGKWASGWKDVVASSQQQEHQQHKLDPMHCGLPGQTYACTCLTIRTRLALSAPPVKNNRLALLALCSFAHFIFTCSLVARVQNVHVSLHSESKTCHQTCVHVCAIGLNIDRFSTFFSDILNI